MEHLEGHPHAFLNNNSVVWVGVFAEHDEDFLQTLKPMFEADSIICCCNVGQLPSPGWIWDGIQFIQTVD